jgi:hypothetical protein
MLKYAIITSTKAPLRLILQGVRALWLFVRVCWNTPKDGPCKCDRRPSTGCVRAEAGIFEHVGGVKILLKDKMPSMYRLDAQLWLAGQLDTDSRSR